MTKVYLEQDEWWVYVPSESYNYRTVEVEVDAKTAARWKRAVTAFERATQEMHDAAQDAIYGPVK